VNFLTANFNPTIVEKSSIADEEIRMNVIANSNPAEIAATPDSEAAFADLRRKVQRAEILSAAVLRLLLQTRFTGRLSVVVQNGRVLKSGYEEGYFRHRDSRLLP
jgi:hypothetical protein